jgi:hypothetical protein
MGSAGDFEERSRSGRRGGWAKLSWGLWGGGVGRRLFCSHIDALEHHEAPHRRPRKRRMVGQRRRGARPTARHGHAQHAVLERGKRLRLQPQHLPVGPRRRRRRNALAAESAGGEIREQARFPSAALRRCRITPTGYASKCMHGTAAQDSGMSDRQAYRLAPGSQERARCSARGEDLKLAGGDGHADGQGVLGRQRRAADLEDGHLRGGERADSAQSASVTKFRRFFGLLWPRTGKKRATGPHGHSRALFLDEQPRNGEGIGRCLACGPGTG